MPPGAEWEYGFMAVAEDGWRMARVRTDGCVEYFRLHNNPWSGEDHPDDFACQIHLCDIDEEIARLTALKELVMQRYDGDWPR